MSDQTERPTYRKRRLFVAAGVLLTVLLLLAWNLERQRQRVRELKWWIERAGGTVTVAPPLWSQLWAGWHDQPVVNDTYVLMSGAEFDDHWLLAHDDLTALSINELTILSCALDGRDIARLTGKHPLEQFIAANIRNADEVAASLNTSRHLWNVILGDSDLTDTGFRSLPLEQLWSLDVAGTDVSPNGLKDLRRCSHLNELTIDGRQFNEEVRDLILGLNQPLFSLTLRGPTVTDGHVELVKQMDVGGNVVNVRLVKTSVAPEAILELRAKLPPPSLLSVD